jgi:hypothetical protein
MTLRDYTDEEIKGFLAADKLDDEAQAIANRFMCNTS